MPKLLEAAGRRRKSQLRAAAEARVAGAALLDAPAAHADDLLHELRVHQIELEMQNDELRRAQLALEESRDRYVDLYEFSPVGYLTLTATTQIVDANLTAAALLGLERKKLLRQRFTRLVAAECRERWLRLFRGALSDDATQNDDVTLTRGDGSIVHVRLDCRRAFAEMTSWVVRAALTDISERKQAERQLRVAAAAFEAQEGMMVTDAHTVILRVNTAFTEITGYSSAEAVGQTPRLLRSDRHDTAFFDAMWDEIRRHGSWRGEIWNRCRSGEVHPEWMTITAVPGDDGEISHYVGTLTDITERKAAADEMAHLAFYDTLTGLPNRRLLLERLGRAMATGEHSGRHAALLFIDLDHFKVFNDSLGHDVGDMLLKSVATRLLSCVREGDSVARLGGDEFVVLLEDLSCSPRDAALQAESIGAKILAALNQAHTLAGREQHSTPSIGITVFRGHRETVDELLKKADLAMYQAKASGRNALRFFDPEIRAAVSARAALEADLRRALRKGEFLLRYQPQVDRDGRLTGAEALLRWQHPQRGEIFPGEFISLAEDSGLIVPLGQWVLATACAQLVAWVARPETAHLNLGVNVSARQFHDPDFVAQVLTILDDSGTDPQRLKLELTESLLLTDVEDTITKMAALKAYGVGFSLDDFGTGYSALSYLKRLPLDELKIDQCFVRDVLTDRSDAAIARTIIALALSLGLTVIAEGVETEAQRDFLAEHGCNAFQGDLFGPPGPAELLAGHTGARRGTVEASVASRP